MNNNYLILDFDGVICESTNECALTSLKAWELYLHKKTLLNNFDIKKSYLEKFSKLRPYIKGAKDYYYLHRYINTHSILDIDSFISFKNNTDNEAFIYEKIFYQTREDIKKTNYKKWIDLNFVFPDVINFIRNINPNNFFIITLKDKISVKEILDSAKYNMDPNRIFDYKEIKNKLQGLNKILNTYSLNKKNLYFIDDICDHLLEPKKNNYNVFLSNWGMLDNSKYLNMANKNSIKILDRINDVFKKEE